VTNLLEDLGNIGITGWFGCDKAGLEAHVTPIEVDTLKEDDMKMKIQIETSAESLDKRDRSRLHLVPLNTAFDHLVDIKLRDRGTDRSMNLRHQIT
jgi:hypothetical protein